jgi:hypothetical protein
MSIENDIREALRQLPNLAMASSGNPPMVDDVYFPISHVEALNPDVALVIGNRGMGKTFWTLALADPQVRLEIGRRYFELRRLNFDQLEVQIGFADAEGAVGMVSSAILDAISPKIPTELIWRAVVLRTLGPIVDAALPKTFKGLVDWIRANPEEQLDIFRAADRKLVSENRTVLILFDQLDQLAGNWDRIQSLTQGLLKVALAMKSYRSIKLKLFMRPDQAENKQLFQFPDASKILGGRQILSWRASDLYGLLFFEIMKSDRGEVALVSLCQQLGLPTDIVHPRLSIPMVLVSGNLHQGTVFNAIAGEYMGKGSKRGRPYTWLPVHLADGRGEISPRTFLQVIKTAAEWQGASEATTPIEFRGILEGVRKASSVRLAELEEDYPWVSEALEPLRGLLVPCENVDIAARWDEARTAKLITTRHKGTRAPIDLELAQLFGNNEEARVILQLMREIGVLEERQNGKINVPDIFRVNAGILRKGGVPPQDRGRL